MNRHSVHHKKHFELSRRRALTLLEILAVLVILAALAAVVVPLVGGAREQGQEQVTQASLSRLRDAIIGKSGASYWEHTGRMPRAIVDLYVVPTDDITYLPLAMQVYDPRTQRGWNGPYMTTGLGSGPLDGYGNPIVVQWPTQAGFEDQWERYVRLIAPGKDGVVTTPPEYLMPAAALRGDDIVLFLRVADQP